MYKSYKDIFNHRGLMYHQAMTQYPLARVDEFNYIIQLAEVQDDYIICDVPSGGCYLSNFVDKDIKLFSIETSEQFIQCSQTGNTNNTIVCEDLSQIPLLPNTIDCVISLAGSHHLESRVSFYQEAYRILKSAGIFCLADVRKESGVAEFLNTFVDQHNSMGHKGDFLDASTKSELETVGFQISYCQPIHYYWYFDCLDSMVNCCKLLFGIDRASSEQILEGIQEYLGCQTNGNQCCMNWELYFFKGVKA